MVQILDDRRKFVRRTSLERDHPDCQRATVKYPTKVMVWSVISCKGTGRLEIVRGMMNQVEYRRIIDKRLVPQLREWFPENDCIFMQDGAPCHRARKIMEHFRELGYRVLDWPGNSPDMNPIEGLWNDLKDEMSKIVSTNKKDLIARLIDVWHHNPRMEELAQSYIEGMPKRVAAVIAAKGGCTKY